MRTSRTPPSARRLVMAAAAISLLALTACNGTEPAADEAVGDTEQPAAEDADATEQPAAEEADPAEQPEAGADAVVARNINFEPAEITVEVGTEVSFTNEDIVRHTVTAGTPDAEEDTFDLSLDAEGDVVTFTFDEAGAYDFFCRLHPAMTGTVTVEG